MLIMMQVLREKFKGWVAIVIFTIIGLTFLLWGVGSYLQGHGGGSSQVLATVNKEKITLQDFDAKRQDLSQAALAKASPEQKKYIKSFIISKLIQEKLLAGATQSAGYVVAPQIIEAQVMTAPYFQVNGQFSQAKFNDYLNSNRLPPMTPAMFAQQRAHAFAQQQLPLGIAASAFITLKEQQQLLALFRQKRSFSTVMVPLSAYYDKVKLTSKQLEDYYHHNQESFVTAEKVKLQYVILSPKDIAAKVQVSSAQVKQYYADNEQHFALPAHWVVDRLIIKLPSNPSVADVKEAKALAVSIKAKLVAGKVTMQGLVKSQPKKMAFAKQTIIATQLSGGLLQTLSSLQQGQFSDPVMTTQGLNLFKMVAIRVGSVKPFASVSKNISALLKQRQMGQLFTTNAQQLGNLAYTHPDSLAQAAKEMELTLQTSAWLSHAGAKKGLFANAALINSAFSKDVLQHGNNSRPLPLPDGSILVLRVVQHVAAKPKPYAQVVSSIRQILLKQSAARFAGVAAYNLQTKWLSGQSLVSLKQYRYDQYHIHNDILRSNKKLSPLVINSVFQLSLGKNSMKTLQLDNGDYLVIKLLGVKDASEADYTAVEKTAKMQSVKSIEVNAGYRMYVQGLLKRAKVTNNNDALSAIKL
jgi:peptidyl-prolyl cis-trans isomerase D